MKKEYIENLLLSINELREKVISLNNGDNISFSFFKDAFNKTESIMRNLHEMEIHQIEEMKGEIKKLIMFLADQENKENNVVQKQEYKEEDQSISPDDLTTNVPYKDNDAEIQKSHKFERNIILPEYRKSEKPANVDITDNAHKSERPSNIDITDNIPSEKSANVDYPNKSDNSDNIDTLHKSYNSDKSILEHTSDENPAILSLNDKIHKEPVVLDLKRSLSLNDRFLFQRELFNNDRLAMNSTMLKLNAFDNFKDVEEYLQDNMKWNFEDKYVIDFLNVLKKGFE